MANKFTDYDMRKFVIKDNKDIYSFFEATRKGLEQVEIIVKKQAMSNAAQAGVIKSLEKKISSRGVTIAESDIDTTTFGEVVENSAPDEAKDNLIQRLKAASEPNEEAVDADTPSDEAEDAADVSTPEEGEGNKAIEPEVEEKKDVVRYRDFEKKRFKNGQTRYFYNGILAAKADVPEEIRAKLDELLG